MKRYRTVYRSSPWATPRELSRRLGVNVAEFGRARKLGLLKEGVDYKPAGELQQGQARRLYDRNRVVRKAFGFSSLASSTVFANRRVLTRLVVVPPLSCTPRIAPWVGRSTRFGWGNRTR